MSEEDADPFTFFADRGIPEEIWRARPYTFWTPDNPEPATAPFDDLNRRQRRSIARWAAESPGWVINRFPPPMNPPLPKIYPELRPLEKVKIRTIRHWHGDGPEPPGLLPWQRLPGGPGSKTWGAHIGRSKEKVKAGEGKKDEDDHAGVNDEDVHDHVQRAKYIHPPGGWLVDGEYEHDHGDSWKRYAAADRPHYRARHVAKKHKGVDVEGPHAHTAFAKDKTPLASRIDVHPDGVERLRTDRVVFFCIEGCCKADAILAAGGGVFSVPAVGQWDYNEGEELGLVVNEYLAGKTVVIVCDADWDSNIRVANQARLCQNRLRQRGVTDVHIAAPPAWLGPKNTKGVDDFLGAGGHLEDLLVIDYEPPHGLIEFVARNWSWRRDRTWRATEALPR